MARQLSRTTRLQLVFSTREMARLKKVQAEVGIPSMGATLRTALEIYSMVVTEQQAGSKIVSVRETDSGPQEKEILIL